MERFSYDFLQAASRHPALSIKALYHRGSRRTSPLFALLVIPRALWLSRRFDVIYLGDPMLAAAGWLVKVIWRRPVAVTVHGLDIVYPHPLYQLYLRLFFRSFDCYFPIGAAVASCLNKLNISGRITQLKPPLTADYFDSSLTRADLLALLARHGLDLSLRATAPSPIFLFTVGRLVPRKGHAWFITRVMPALPPHVHYLVAGAGPQTKSLRTFITDNHLEDRVHLLGRVSVSDLRILYNTVDAFIQPNIHVSGDIEGFGLVVLEAAACQLPVFAAAVDGLPDAVIPGQNGQLLPAADDQAWINALQPLVARPYRVPQARTFTLQTFGWPAYLQSMLAVLADVEAAHGRN